MTVVIIIAILLIGEAELLVHDGNIIAHLG
jgi:hypothetical protein